MIKLRTFNLDFIKTKCFIWPKPKLFLAFCFIQNVHIWADLKWILLSSFGNCQWTRKIQYLPSSSFELHGNVFHSSRSPGSHPSASSPRSGKGKRLTVPSTCFPVSAPVLFPYKACCNGFLTAHTPTTLSMPFQGGMRGEAQTLWLPPCRGGQRSLGVPWAC